MLLTHCFVIVGQEVTSANTSLSCYVCDDKFTNVWDPYTDCQVRLDKVDVKTCLAAEEYCLVRRRSYIPYLPELCPLFLCLWDSAQGPVT